MSARDPLKLELSGRRPRGTPTARSLRRWAEAALGPKGRGREIAVRLVARPESRRLNAQWRGKDKPTNVLSFPAPAAPLASSLLGDLVICGPVVREEARAQRKRLDAHWAHLVVHGALHLAGYDHEDDADARRMERREIAVLRRFGIANPYVLGAG